MKIKLNEIETMLSAIFSLYKQEGILELDLKNDFYWDFSQSEIYNTANEPKDFSIGQLSDDWQTLNHEHTSDQFVPYDLQRIANIIRAIGIEHQIINGGSGKDN